MRALPCKTVGCGGHDRLRGAAVLKDQSPYIVGRAPADFPHRIFCAKCKRVTVLTRMEWNQLPALTQEHIDEVTPPEGLSHRDFKAMTKDVRES